MTNPEKIACIETFGCQMNERDTEIMAQLLTRAGYEMTNEPDRADLVVVNTCSIRGKAEQKAMSLLGRLKHSKRTKPGLIVAVTGCVAQQEGGKIQERMNHVDLVIGPQAIYRLPELLDSLQKNGGKMTAIDQAASFTIPSLLPDPGNSALPHKRFVTIMQGCNNFCTYCVVPYTRGREVSRPPADIIAEVKHLAANNVREITLLGQNVNSYGLDRKDRDYPDFPTLLRKVAEIAGVARLRFTTSNPKDLSEELMKCFAELDNLCPHFHLPVQSGSDVILKKMNRKYTIGQYLEKIAGLRRYCPDIAITTDIIVGFPGESAEDFAATMVLLEKVRYHGAYSFKYSDRPHTVSAGFADKVLEEVKSERLRILQARQQEITTERYRACLGHVMEIMVEGESRNGEGQWSGRTGSNHIVNFSGGETLQPGQILEVRIDEACQHSLRGNLI
ncbi:MAG: tRNA (N6-isopentenyl adenosine(37)-C2)-methylthiotransferase MiaB [Desulfurivibrionaceae bacterium]|nr:tRNA (N6-isopentenyl adenosine(37)-C2)-methylthiotransferase MiaB [Desulfobulbales bacterium]MDT8334810.1 tRNA (N6-isopentenyl adenosine(37)-C2)-methylthiotransferase MiaB [Desulfurivibrionaceae bacterium]